MITRFFKALFHPDHIDWRPHAGTNPAGFDDKALLMTRTIRGEKQFREASQSEWQDYMAEIAAP